MVASVASVPIEASSNMSVDGGVVTGAEFDILFTGALSDSRGGYFWLERPDGTRMALLRSDGNAEIPMGYDLGVDDAMMLDDGLSGDTSRLLLPPDIEPGPYRLCTANSLGDDCTEIDVLAI